LKQEPAIEYSIRDLLRILDRRRHIALTVMISVLLLSVVACLIMTRRYEAKGVFELQKSSSDGLDLESMIGGAAGGASDSLTVNTELQTEASILQSDTLALKVIKDLNLRENRDFQPRFPFLDKALGFFSPSGPPDRAGASIEDAPNAREHLLKTFSNHLDVKVQAGTRLIEVDFTNRDPKVAAAVVNHLIQGLIDYTFQTKYNATNEVSSWLENQLSDLRKQSEDLQAKVVAMQQGSGIFGVGGTDLQGKPVVYSPVLDRLQQSSALLTQSEMSRIVKESVYQIAKTRNPETISQLAGTSLLTQSGQGVTNSLQLLQNLRGQEATLKAQIGQDESQFGPAYPKLIEEKASLRSVETSLEQESNRIAQRAKNDYDIASATEAGVEKTYNSDRHAAEKLNDKTIEYMILSRESEESQALYQDLLKRLKEAGILEGLRSSNITNVDNALPPAKPSRPDVKLLLAGGLFLGIFLGGGAALLVDAVDNKIQGTEEIESAGMPLLGIVPIAGVVSATKRLPGGGGAGGVLMDSDRSEFAESIRRLRSTLLIARSGVAPQVLLITSGSPSEGKSLMSLNLAVALAQYGKKVLLVEADMRRPVLKRRIHLKTTKGLSTLLTDHTSGGEPEVLPNYPNLSIIPAGPVPPYPSELLGSASLTSLFDEWRKEYDFVVLDSPPVLPVADTQILVAHSDATVLIARAGSTTRVGLGRSFNLLRQHAANPSQPAIGILVNGVSSHSAAYYGYYGTYGYKGYHSQGENTHEDN
jgi:polysaccharide biosynthesis transport protein